MMTLTRRRWVGAENLGRPGEGRVVAANHLSWFDPLVIAHIMNDNDRMPRFLAKDAVFDVPIVGSMASGTGQIPVYRDSDNAGDVVRAAVDAVRGGEAVVVYPEGTLTRDPDLWPMTGKTGAARIALESGQPVVPMAHWGVQQIMRPYHKEFRVLPRKLLKVSVGPPVDLDDLRGRALDADVLTEATSRIMDAIAGQLAFLRGERVPRDRWSLKQGRRLPIEHPLPPPGADAPRRTEED
jgi:1-acyl-sn-glycerol-3-phosphate acyltransferase